MRRQCELLGVTRSTVYYAPRQPDEASIERKEAILARIDFWHTTMPYLGTRKIAARLQEEGYAVGRKLVRSYMQEMGIHAYNGPLVKTTHQKNIVNAFRPF